MLYEQSLDLDTFQSFLNQNSDHDPRFYDEFFTLATSHEWKSSNRLPGLPTPPATPNTPSEKTTSGGRFASWAGSTGGSGGGCGSTSNASCSNRHCSSMTPHMYHHSKHHNNNDYSQVVPDVVQDDRNDYVQPWFHDPVQTTSSPIDIPRKHNNSYHRHQESPYVDSPYSSFTSNNNTGLEDQLRSTSYSTHTHLNLQHAMENQMPECNTTVTPTSKCIKRNYYNSYCPEMPPINDSGYDSGLRSSEENYFRQLAYERARKRTKLNIIEAPPPEPELSKATHNVLERQRRNDLKLRFSILRDNIPEMTSNDKVPKIQILKKAQEYIEQLKAQEQKNMVDLELEKQRKIILETRLKQLRGSY